MCVVDAENKNAVVLDHRYTVLKNKYR